MFSKLNIYCLHYDKAAVIERLIMTSLFATSQTEVIPRQKIWSIIMYNGTKAVSGKSERVGQDFRNTKWPAVLRYQPAVIQLPISGSGDTIPRRLLHQRRGWYNYTTSCAPGNGVNKAKSFPRFHNTFNSETLKRVSGLFINHKSPTRKSENVGFVVKEKNLLTLTEASFYIVTRLQWNVAK